MLDLATRAKPRPAVRQLTTFPAPTGGLNLRDSIADMSELDALLLDNYFPESNYVQLRNGSSSHATGISGDVESLMEWAGPATRKLFAANSSAVYNVTSAGAVGAAEFSGQSNGRWSHTMMATAAGNFLCAVNGANSYRNYDGTTWTTPAVTNVTASTLNFVTTHKNRLWFVEGDSTSAWFLPVNAISGAATELDLGPQFILGGKLLIIGSISHDAGNGADDYLCFISSRGDLAIYQGTDPTDATKWSIVGRYRIGAPVSNRALIKTGGDLVMISQDGIVSILQMMNLDRAAADKASVSNKIDSAIADGFRLYGANFGWQGIIYPKAHWALVNIPVSSTEDWQYVMNTQTGAWCRFKGQNAKCWSLLGDDLYFGITGGVYKADTGTADNGANITGDIGTAYQYFGQSRLNKHFKLIRPMIVTNGRPAVMLRLTVDFKDETPTTDDIFQASLGTSGVWDSSTWDNAVWGGTDIIREWYATYGLGTCAAIRLRTQTNGFSIRFNSFDVIYEAAGLDL